MQLPVEPINLPASVVASSAGAAIGAILGFPVACTIFEGQLRGSVPSEVVALTTAGLSFLVVLRASGRNSGWSAVGSTVGFGLVAGGLNAGLACQFKSLGEGHSSSLAPFMLGSLLGIVFAGPLALAFAVALLVRAPPPGAHYRAGESPRLLAALDPIGG